MGISLFYSPLNTAMVREDVWQESAVFFGEIRDHSEMELKNRRNPLKFNLKLALRGIRKEQSELFDCGSSVSLALATCRPEYWGRVTEPKGFGL